MIDTNDASSGFQFHALWKTQEARLAIGEFCKEEKKDCITFEAELLTEKKIINNTCKKVNTNLLIPILCAKRRSRINTWGTI